MASPSATSELVQRKLRKPDTRPAAPKYSSASQCPGFEFDPIYGFQGRCKVCKFSKAEHPSDPLAQLRWLKKQRAEQQRLSAAKPKKQESPALKKALASAEREVKAAERASQRRAAAPPEAPQEESSGWLASAKAGAAGLASAVASKLAPVQEEAKAEDVHGSSSKRASSKRVSSSRAAAAGRPASAPSLAATKEEEEEEEGGDADTDGERGEAAGKKRAAAKAAKAAEAAAAAEEEEEENKRTSSGEEEAESSAESAAAAGSPAAAAASSPSSAAASPRSSTSSTPSRSRFSSLRESMRALSKRVSSRRSAKSSVVEEEVESDEDQAKERSTSADEAAEEERLKAGSGERVALGPEHYLHQKCNALFPELTPVFNRARGAKKSTHWRANLECEEYNRDEFNVLVVECPFDSGSPEARKWLRDNMESPVSKGAWKELDGSGPDSLNAGEFYEGLIVEFHSEVDGLITEPHCSVQFVARAADSSEPDWIVKVLVPVKDLQLSSSFASLGSPASRASSVGGAGAGAGAGADAGTLRGEMEDCAGADGRVNVDRFGALLARRLVELAQELDFALLEELKAEVQECEREVEVRLAEAKGADAVRKVKGNYASYPSWLLAVAVNRRHAGTTALVSACEAFLGWAKNDDEECTPKEEQDKLRERLMVIKVLLEMGADADMAGDEGVQPLALACQAPATASKREVQRRMELIKGLLSKGAETPAGSVVYVANKQLTDFIIGTYGCYKIAVSNEPPPPKQPAKNKAKGSKKKRDAGLDAEAEPDESSKREDARRGSSASGVSWADGADERGGSEDYARRSMASMGSKSSKGSQGMKKLLCTITGQGQAKR